MEWPTWDTCRSVSHMEHPTTTTAAPRLGEVIREAIEKAGHTVRSAALASGIPHSTLDRKIKAGGESFTFAELARIATILGYDRVSDLTESAESAA